MTSLQYSIAAVTLESRLLLYASCNSTITCGRKR